MNKEEFLRQQEELIRIVSEKLLEETLSSENGSDLKILLRILNEYTFENRLQYKGLLSHTVVDSLSSDTSITKRVFIFDHIIK